MSRTGQTSLAPQQDALFEYRQRLMSILSKFSDHHTLKTGIEEIKKFMMNDITETERMNMFLNSLSDHNEHMKPQQKKEYIKIYGLAAEIFEESLIPFIPKILGTMAKKLKEGTSVMHQAIAETLGQMVLFIVEKGEDHSEKVDLLHQFLKLPYNLLEKSPNKVVQEGGALCLSKLIQNSPEEILYELLQEVTEKMIALVKLTQFKAHTTLLECLISLIFHVEQEFTPFAPKFLPVLIEFIASNEWSTKKVAIDAIYSMSAILKEDILPFRIEILQVLNHCRFDKIKPVREATQETIKLLKDIGPPLTDHQLALIEDKPKQISRMRSKERSPQSVKGGQNNSQTRLKKQQTTISEALEDDSFRKSRQNRKVTPTKNSTKTTIVSRQDTIEADQDASFQKSNKGEKKVSAATLKRRAAASPLRDGNVSTNSLKKERKDLSCSKESKQSIFARTKNPNFFQENQDIEIFEGKKPSNFDEVISNQQRENTYEDEEEEEESQQEKPNLSQDKCNTSRDRVRNRMTRADRLNYSNSQNKLDSQKQILQKQKEKFAKANFKKQSQNQGFNDIQIFEPKQNKQILIEESSSPDTHQRQKSAGQELEKSHAQQQEYRFSQANDISFSQDQRKLQQNHHQASQSEHYGQTNQHQHEKYESEKKPERSKDEDVVIEKQQTPQGSPPQKSNKSQSIDNRNAIGGGQEEYQESRQSYVREEEEMMKEQRSMGSARQDSYQSPVSRRSYKFEGTQDSQSRNRQHDELQPRIIYSSQTGGIQASQPMISPGQMSKFESLQYSNMSQNLQLVMMQVEKMSQSQRFIQDAMQSFQDSIKYEVQGLKNKISSMEKHILEVQVNSNSKISGEEVKELIDKKFNVLQEYRKETENLSKKCQEMSSQFRTNIFSHSTQNFNTFKQDQLYQAPHSDANFDKESSQSSFFEKQSESYPNQNQTGVLMEENRSKWKQISIYLDQKNYQEAFNLSLMSEDEMLFIRLLSKTGSFLFEQLNQGTREQLVDRVCQMIDQKEFLEILIPSLVEAAEKSTKQWSVRMRMEVQEKVLGLMFENTLKESQRHEVKKLMEKIKSM